MTTIIGIDPGVSGAVVMVSDSDKSQPWVLAEDMPTIEVRGRRHVDCHKLVRLLRSGFPYKPDMVVLEHVQGVQGTGATSAFSFGRSFGLIEGVVSALGYPLTLVRPQLWTKDLALSRDKGARRLVASNLWPANADLFGRVKDDGRADAALLCHWYITRGKAA